MTRKKHAQWKVLKTRQVHETQWMKLREDTIDVGGVQVVYTYIQKVGDGPIVLAVYKNKLLMVRQYRHPIGKVIWQFSAEHCDPYESQEEAALRCVSEELGFSCQRVILLGSLYTDPGLSNQKSNFYLAESLKPLPTHTSEGIEDLEISSFSLDEIALMIKDGTICDNWTLAGLSLYKQYLETL